MEKERNEKIFKEEITVFKYLTKEYLKELSKLTKYPWSHSVFKSTRKARLSRLRMEINNILMSIEKSVPSNCYLEEKN